MGVSELGAVTWLLVSEVDFDYQFGALLIRLRMSSRRP